MTEEEILGKAEEAVKMEAEEVGNGGTETEESEVKMTEDFILNGDEGDEKVEPQTASNNTEEENLEYENNDVYKNLRSQQVAPKVAVALINLYDTTEMGPEDIDERAIEMLRSFPIDQACFVIKEVKESNMMGVQNKAQYLMSIMRNFRDRLRAVGPQAAIQQPLLTGPDQEAVKAILDRTGYSLEVTVGQRKYGGPPPDWDGPSTGPAGSGNEIYIGHIPKELYEDALIPLFEQVGKIWDLRLMMDPLTGKNRGYAFLTYCDKACAAAAAKKYDGFEVRPGKNLKVNVSVANTRLFIGNIPKSKSKDEILTELKLHAEGVTDAIIYSSPDASENRKNRGFCFVDFVDHKAASDAKRKIQAGKMRPWNCDLVVDWAEQQDEPDEDTMAKVKVLYVRNLREAVTEEQLKEMFQVYGEVDRAKKIRDYAFIHFAEREPALAAMEKLHGTVLDGIAIDVSLAKPQSERSKAARRARAARGMPWMQGYGRGGGGGAYDYYGSGSMRGTRARGMAAPAGYGMGGGARGYGMPPDYGYGYDAYGAGGYDDAYGGYGGGGYGAGGYGGGYDYGMGGYGAPDPYYGGGGYTPSAMPRAGRGGVPVRFCPTCRGMLQRGGAPRGPRPMGGRGGMGRGTGGRGGAKRPGDGIGGPASKRPEVGGDAYATDFAADVNMGSF